VCLALTPVHGDAETLLPQTRLENPERANRFQNKPEVARHQRGEMVGESKKLAMLKSPTKWVATSSTLSWSHILDGVHLDIENSRAIGRELEPVVRAMLEF
jgi:lysophospholipase L1-like esterase